MAYPLPAFHFKVEWGAESIAFSEVTGLNIEVQPIEYRAGTDEAFTMQKMPGLKKYGNVTLKRGVFADNKEYFDWLNAIKMNKPEYRTIIISLLDEEHQPVMAWTLTQAWPTKITLPDMKANDNNPAIEQVEIAHEGITLTKPS